jgi:hypothetical protein
MVKIANVKSERNERLPVHRGYELVTRLDNLWNANTLAFDEYTAGEPEMSQQQLMNLILSLQKMRKECRVAIRELLTLRT